jgi:chromosome segregation ATPase
VSREQHDRRGPSSCSAAYKRWRRAQQRIKAARQPDDRALQLPPDVDGAEMLLSLSQQTNNKLSSAELTSVLSADDRTLLQSAVQRLLRPHTPASGQAGGLQRSNSGNKAVTDLLDMLRKLGQQLQQTKQEAEEKIEGLEKQAAEALDWWITAEEMLKELQQEDAELKESVEVMAADNAELTKELIDTKRQLTVEKGKPKLPQGRKDIVNRFVQKCAAPLMCSALT